MGKPAAERRLAESEAAASMRGLRTSPRKLNLVAQAIRGKLASDALAELVPDHILGNQHRDEFVPVIDAEGEPDKLRKDRRPARPGADHLVAARATRRLRFFEEIAVDKRPLPYRSCQAFPPVG